MKKKLIIFLATIIIMACTASFIGCNNKDSGEQKIMNLSLNPKVEFVLDKQNKVVSVNALNEEGNLIVIAGEFTGKTAEDAAKLFVEVSKETGFLVSGSVNAGENELLISFSGDAKEASKLYNSVKSNIDEYLTSKNITAMVKQSNALTKEHLEALVLECSPYLDEAEIKAMEYNELMQELIKSRQETEEFYSQELKNAYYESKAFAMEQAEIQAIKVQEGISGLALVAFDSAFNVYKNAVVALEKTRINMLVKEDSPYQIALANFREAKAEYLNYRNYIASLEQTELTTQISQQLATFKTVVDTAESALLQAGESARLTLNSVREALDGAYSNVVSLIEEYSAKASQYASIISTKQQEAQTAFYNDFEASYADLITLAETRWNEMQNKLENGYVKE